MKRRLRRDTNNEMLCGVCAGVARYFDIDPTLVRLIWALVSITGGGGVLLYIIAAIIMPEDDGSDDYYDIVE